MRRPSNTPARAGYLFGTGGGAWVSSDLVNWKYQTVDVRGGRLPVAPHVVNYNGAFYMSGNSAPLCRAPNILGPSCWPILPAAAGSAWTPQWAPAVVANPARDGGSGSVPLSVNRL